MPAAVTRIRAWPGPGSGTVDLDLVEHVGRLAGAVDLPGPHRLRHVASPRSMMVAALSSSRSTWVPKNSWIGLSDRPRWNLA